VCLIFCEPRQQDVVDLLCSLASLSKDAPVNLAAMALSRLQPAQEPSVPLPTWHIEEKYTASVPLYVQEDVKPKPVSVVPTSVIYKPHDDTSIKLDIENILFGHSSSDPRGDDICGVTLGQDKIIKVTNGGRRKILTRKGASQWGGKRKAAPPSGRKKAGGDKTANKKKETAKTSLDSSSSSIKAEVVEEECAEVVEEECADNNLDIHPDPTAQRFANMKVLVPQQGFSGF
jgi:hypothetical protein